MTALTRQIKLETKIFARERQNLFLTMAFPLILFFIFGSVFDGQSWSGIAAKAARSDEVPSAAVGPHGPSRAEHLGM